MQKQFQKSRGIEIEHSVAIGAELVEDLLRGSLPFHRIRQPIVSSDGQSHPARCDQCSAPSRRGRRLYHSDQASSVGHPQHLAALNPAENR